MTGTVVATMFLDFKTSFASLAGDACSPEVSPHSPSMILFTLQMRRVMIRLMASQGLLGPLATVEATMGAKDKMMIAPSNTWREISFLNLLLKSHPHCSSLTFQRTSSLPKRNVIMVPVWKGYERWPSHRKAAYQNSSVLFMRWGEKLWWKGRGRQRVLEILAKIPLGEVIV